MNRKIYEHKYDDEYKKKYYEWLFDLYVKRRWYYIGGNFEDHLSYFNIICPNENIKHSGYCHLCYKRLPSKVFYIKDYLKNKKAVIAKCCLDKIHGYHNIYKNTYKNTYVLDKRSKRFKLKTD